jgi:hypothetical protein
MAERKATDEAAQRRKASSEDQAKAAGPLSVRDDVEDTPTASELIEKKPEVFGENLEHQFDTSTVTADQRAMVEDGKPKNEPAKVADGREPKVGERVILTTATPIGGQTDNGATIIGFNPINGNANLRLEFTDGGRARGGANAEYGGVPYGAAQEERGSFWRYPEDFAADK